MCLRGSSISADDDNIRLFVICALRVNKREISVYTVRTFMKCTHVSAAQKAYWLFTSYR